MHDHGESVDEIGGQAPPFIALLSDLNIDARCLKFSLRLCANFGDLLLQSCKIPIKFAKDIVFACKGWHLFEPANRIRVENYICLCFRIFIRFSSLKNQFQHNRPSHPRKLGTLTAAR